MLFRVIDQFKWAGTIYEQGDTIDIPESHPLVPGLIRGGHVVYEDRSPAPTPKLSKDRLAGTEQLNKIETVKPKVLSMNK
jgi:hypothetical protein